MKNFSIRGAFIKGWHLWKAHWKLLVLVTLVFLILELPIPDVQNSDTFTWWKGGVSIVIGILYFAVYLGWIKILFKIHDHEPTDFRELFRHINLFWRALGTTFLFALIVAAGLILLIVPGIYWMLKYQFAPLAVIDRPNISIKEAFRLSASATDGVKWKLLGFIILSSLLTGLGDATKVGILIALPVTLLATISIYRGLAHPKNP